MIRPLGARRRDNSFAEEKRPTEKRLFALLDLDGTLFHMMPEAELPGNIGHVTEAVVPLPDGAMRRLMQQKKTPQGLLLTSLPSTTTSAGDDDSPVLEEARHLMAVRRGTRQLLASLRQSGVELRVVTANLLGDAAVDALVDRENAEVAASTAAAAAAASEVERGTLEENDRNGVPPAPFPPPPARGWSGSPVVRVTVVVDRAPGSKRLPDDVVEALRTDPKGTKVVILDDNPTAWEARAKQHIWIVPQFDVRRPLTRAEFDDELGLLERISARCKRFFATQPAVPAVPAPTAVPAPAPAAPPKISSPPQPPPPAPSAPQTQRRRRETRTRRASRDGDGSNMAPSRRGGDDDDDDEDWKGDDDEDEDDPDWEREVMASRE